MTTAPKPTANPVAGRARKELLERFGAFPDRVGSAARDAATRPPVPDEWTPEQVVRHLIAVETVVHQARLLDVAVHDRPAWGWTEPGPWMGEPDLDLDGLLGRFAELRAATVATVRALDGDGWARSGQHATYGMLDIAGLLTLATDHDAEHLGGLEQHR
jgi:DinB family protein